jgi:hypothetical protein
MIAASYKTKKSLKESVGKRFQYVETSFFGSEFRPNKVLTVVGPSAHDRRWYANVVCDENEVLLKVS